MGRIERIHHALYVKCREKAERDASPTAAIIDSQSVKSAEKGGAHRRFRVRRGQENQRQKAPCPCRHARPADARRDPRSRVQDRDGGVLVMATLLGLYPFLLKLYADGGLSGTALSGGAEPRLKPSDLEIVKRSDTTKHLRFCENAGLWSEPSAGSTAAVGWQRIGNA